jgi:hypothetical protein
MESLPIPGDLIGWGGRARTPSEPELSAVGLSPFRTPAPTGHFRDLNSNLGCQRV